MFVGVRVYEKVFMCERENLVTMKRFNQVINVLCNYLFIKNVIIYLI